MRWGREWDGELGKGNVMDHMCILGNDLSTVV